MLVTEQVEEVYWLLISLHLCVQAEVWRVELTRVRNPNDVVEEACHHPSKLDGVVHSADRNASKFSDCAHVLSCFAVQISCPRVDQESLSGSRRAAQNSLAQ